MLVRLQSQDTRDIFHAAEPWHPNTYPRCILIFSDDGHNDASDPSAIEAPYAVDVGVDMLQIVLVTVGEVQENEVLSKRVETGTSFMEGLKESLGVIDRRMYLPSSASNCIRNPDRYTPPPTRPFLEDEPLNPSFPVCPATQRSVSPGRLDPAPA